MNFITDLNSGIVVDREGLNKLKTEAMGVAMADIYNRGKEVIVVDNVRAFFGDATLFRALEGNVPGLVLILEQRGIKLEDEQMATVNAFVDLKTYIKEQIAALAPPIPPYTFAEIPTGWTVENNIKIGKTTIRRRTGSDTSHSIGLKTFATLWGKASNKWAAGPGMERARSAGRIPVAGYSRNIDVYAEHVTVGCQRIRRYELEQVALALGLDLPEMSTSV